MSADLNLKILESYVEIDKIQDEISDADEHRRCADSQNQQQQAQHGIAANKLREAIHDPREDSHNN